VFPAHGKPKLLLSLLSQNTMAGHRVHAEGSRGAIFEATTVCLQSFTDCLAVKELMRNEWAENRLADFNLWISGTGALARSRASLDSRLAPRPEAASVIANVLQLLSGTVDECMRVGKMVSQCMLNMNGF
jgi:hypothetical protein